ncbi:hypothetical protein FHS27_005447 [Rhodopirellula rubra]|uniref:Uncharacterized protein n=1 Tax=Aporhodopirellula rubra TaxID=980271 RepID=A0A7W5E4B4_9BACT|nr:hypothetical protein [Aporhodopirellula rubra]
MFFKEGWGLIVMGGVSRCEHGMRRQPPIRNQLPKH